MMLASFRLDHSASNFFAALCMLPPRNVEGIGWSGSSALTADVHARHSDRKRVRMKTDTYIQRLKANAISRGFEDGLKGRTWKTPYKTSGMNKDYDDGYKMGHELRALLGMEPRYESLVKPRTDTK